MVSINKILNGHSGALPATWKRSQGLRALFPRDYKGSISPLKRYVTFFYARLATQGYNLGERSPSAACFGDFWFAADAQGRWFFGWIYGASYKPTGYPRQGGFVFKSPLGSSCRGFVDESRPAQSTRSCHGGTDAVLQENWPSLLTGGVRVLFQLESNPDPSAVWTGAGFPKDSFQPLIPTISVAEGNGSGSTLFPFPKSIPKDALNPPPIYVNHPGDLPSGDVTPSFIQEPDDDDGNESDDDDD